MAELVKKLGLPQPDGFLYFVENDCTVWKHQGGQKTLISDVIIDREEGYLYFIDLNGDLAKKSNTQQRDKDTNNLYKPGTQVPRD
jgi:hypothetical protein|tara:strand:+ start:480 stop:734 length:255 start_codon:yes stop_codon:yes gene_type:complete